LQTSLRIQSAWARYTLYASAAGYATRPSVCFDNAGTGRLSGLTLLLAPAPGNDAFSDRFVLTGTPVYTSGNNANATYEGGEPPDAYSGSGDKSVWFTWTAPSTGARTVSVSSGSMYYPILAIYTGTQLTNLTKVADVIGLGYSATTTLNATAGTAYQIEVDDYYGYGGAYSLAITP
jgi:hypothetical protein